MEGDELRKLCCDSALVTQDSGILSSELLRLLIDIDLKFLAFILEGFHPHCKLMYLIMQTGG